MPRTTTPPAIVRAVRDQIAGDGLPLQEADRFVVRMLIDELAYHRGLRSPDWPALPLPADPAIATAARQELARLDMTAWDITDISGAYEHLLGRAGAWFTPPPVAECMARFALEPQLDRLGEHPDPGNVLQILAVDPACGCGVYLEAAATVIAGRYAQRLFGEASDLTVAIVLPEVLSETIFGIDIDPVAIDICKAALWLMVAREHPITFMDRNIICGDTLAGPHVQPPKLAELLAAS